MHVEEFELGDYIIHTYYEEIPSFYEQYRYMIFVGYYDVAEDFLIDGRFYLN